MIDISSDMRVCMNSGVNAIKCVTREALNIRLGKSQYFLTPPGAWVPKWGLFSYFRFLLKLRIPIQNLRYKF